MIMAQNYQVHAYCRDDNSYANYTVKADSREHAMQLVELLGAEDGLKLQAQFVIEQDWVNRVSKR